jgi:23S rRNA (adenine-N6)-dimethyltransferase
VLDLGAGYGAITSALAQAGARVIAVERDPGLARRLQRRFAGDPGVRVVEADLRSVPLPRREFSVVANPPFSATTALLRRLLDDPATPLAGADLLVQWGAAKWLASPRPRDAETAWWTARYEVRLVRRVPAGSFAPAPSVDAAHVSIRPRPITGMPGGQRALRSLLRAAYRDPGRPVEDVLPVPRRAGADGTDQLRAVVRAVLGPRTTGQELTAAQWHEAGVLLAGGTAQLRRCAHDRR